MKQHKHLHLARRKMGHIIDEIYTALLHYGSREVDLNIVREDKGRRLRAILALGSQDVGDACTMIPMDEGVEMVGCSSDHTIVDVTDTGREWKSGDTLTFKVRYSNMLYAFTGDHLNVEYYYDN